MTQSRIEQVLGAMTIRDAVVDPERQLRKRGLQSRQGTPMVSRPFDGVEIGDVKCLERMDR